VLLLLLHGLPLPMPPAAVPLSVHTFFLILFETILKFLKKKQLFVCSPFGDECLKMIITI